jgi:tRNA(Ile)-lysidine synthase
VSGRARRPASAFGPQWLRAELARLLPQFPHLQLCVAYSGGLDSTALLCALAALARPPLQLRAVHVNHGLRPAAAQWSVHCRSVARGLGVPLRVLTARLERRRGESLEACAREARYRLLSAALRPGEVLLTAHQQDDQLETVLLQLLRGAGVAGLAAMPACASFGPGLLLRPLLSQPRATLAQWLARQSPGWVEDDSNADERLDRNYLRQRVVPLLRARWPAAAASVARSARHAAEAQQLLTDLGLRDAARAAWGAQLSARVLRSLPLPRRHNALRAWIAAAGLRPPPAARLVELAGPLLHARGDAHPAVTWQGARVERSADLLRLSSPAAAPAPAADPVPQRWNWRRARTLVLSQARGTLELRIDARGPLDLDALPAQLSVRTRRGGERLQTRRGGPHRALKSLLQELRVPLRQRQELPLLYAGERLLAVGDLWLDASVQAHAAGRRRGRLLWHPLAPPPARQAPRRMEMC